MSEQENRPATRHQLRLGAWLRGEASIAPVTTLLGIVPLEFADGTARIAMDGGPAHHNAFGTVHGGLLVALADVAMGCALATVLADDEGLSTVQQDMAHLRPVRDGRLVATARVVHRGRAVAHVECDIADAQGALLARASCVCAIVRLA